MGKAEDNKREKYERILAAARDLFRTRGYEGTTMDEVAKQARVSKGSVFFHASSKAALLNQVFQVDMHRWVEEAFAQPDQGDIVEDLVAKYATLQISMCLQPELTRVYMSHVVFALDERERMLETMELILSLTRRAIDAAKDAGQVTSDVDTFELASNLFSLYFVRQMVWVAQPGGGFEMDERDFLRPAFATQLGPLLVGTRTE